MNDVYYRTGQAAKLLGISTHHLRRLCEAALVEHELTAGGHYQIPMSEIQRLKREGVPPIPQTLEREEFGPARRGASSGCSSSEPIGAEPSEDVTRSAEEVTITDNQIRKRRLELEAEELEDRFRDRAEKQAALAEHRRQQAAAREAAEDHRREMHKWMEYGLRQVPSAAPREIESDVYRAVEEALQSVSLDCPGSVIRRVVDAAVERALKPWRRETQTEEAVQEARGQLPYSARAGWGRLGEWELRAIQRASVAIGRLRDDATTAEMEAAARQAGEEVTKEFEHKQACQDVLKWTALYIPREATAAEREQAEETVREALQELQVGATRPQLESARNAALLPLKRRAEKREQERLAREATESKHRDAEFTATLHLSDVDEYLEEFEFESIVDQLQTSEKLKKQIRPLLVKQLLRRDMSREEIRGFIRNRVQERV